MSEDQRVEPKTIELDAVQVLSQLIKGIATDVKASREEAAENFTKVEGRLTSQDTKLDKVITEGIEANVRLDRVEVRLTGAEARVDILEGRAVNTSLRVKGASDVGLEASAQLAQERASREALATKVDKLDEVLKAQSDFMGMGKRGAEWLVSEKGRTALAQAAVAVVSAYEVLKHGGVIK